MKHKAQTAWAIVQKKNGYIDIRSIQRTRSEVIRQYNAGWSDLNAWERHRKFHNFEIRRIELKVAR